MSLQYLNDYVYSTLFWSELTDSISVQAYDLYSLNNPMP